MNRLSSLQNSPRQQQLLLLINKTLFFCTLLSFMFVNSRVPQYNDSAAHHYEGLLISQGGRPFIDFIENKNPAIYYVLGLGAWLGKGSFSFNILFFRIFDLLALGLIFFVIRRNTKCWTIATVTSYTSLCAIMQLYDYGMETLYVESQEVFLSGMAYVLYLNRRSAALTGILLGLSFCFRQTALVDAAAIGLHALWTHRGKMRSLFPTIFLLIAGFLLPISFFVALALYQGWLDDLWYWGYYWNYLYKTKISGDINGQLSYQLRRSLLYPGLSILTIGASFGLLLHLFFFSIKSSSMYLVGYVTNKQKFLLWALCLIGHLVEVLSATLIHRHHSYTLVLPLAVFFSYTLVALKSFEAQNNNQRVFTLTLALLSCILTVESFSYINKSIKVLRHEWKELENLDISCNEAGDWIQQHTLPHQRILSWGFRSDIYICAKRFASGPFHHNLILTNFQEKFLPLDKYSLYVFQDSLKKNPPRVILLFDSLPIDQYLGHLGNRYSRGTIEFSNGKSIPILCDGMCP